MRAIAFIVLLLAAGAAAAASGTITVDTSGDVESTMKLRWGCGFVRVGNAASADFGSGTLSLMQLDASGAWATVKTYTAAPDPNPERLDFGGVETSVGVSLGSSTSPDLFWQIESGNCGAR